MEQTFDSYMREKRVVRGLFLRGLAAKLEVSPVYMSSTENDRGPALIKEKICLLYTSSSSRDLQGQAR